MAEVLKGKPVADAITENTKKRADALISAGVVPTLAILRVGEREDDLSYERGATKRCVSAGIAVRSVVLPADVDSDAFFASLDSLNKDDSVHGILMFRPLPPHLDGERARSMLAPSKDVDGCTDGSLAGIFSGSSCGFAPCTAEAAVSILDHYGITIDGKRAVVVGRSLVVGRPAAMLLMHRNATVTVCHTHTVDLPSVIKEADIVIAASGRPESLGPNELREGQTVIDVGIRWSEKKQKLVGDVDFDNVIGLLNAVTPVPGGVGSVTSSVLASHVVTACERSLR